MKRSKILFEARAKTSRLAVRWLHELVPRLSIEMSDFKVPVDILVARARWAERTTGLSPIPIVSEIEPV